MIEKYYNEIYVYAYRQTGNRENAMDLTQEIFISMLQSIGNFDRKKASFRTWLYRIATYKLIDAARKFSPETVALEDLEIPEELDFVKQWEDQELLRRIHAYVQKQGHVLELIYRLRLYQGFSFREIGDSLQLPEATVKSRYHRLCKKIKEEFGDEYQDVE